MAEVNKEKTETQITYQQEIYRKLIHFSSIIIPVVYTSTDHLRMLVVLLPVTALFIALDMLRHYDNKLKALTMNFLGDLIRDGEKDGEAKRLSGASFTLLAACICIFLFPKIVAITALIVAAVADPIAALIGRKFGKKEFLGKTVEGTLAFILSGVMVVFAVSEVAHENVLFIVSGSVAVCLAAVMEAASKVIHIDDNFSVPVIMGFFMGILI